MEMLPELQKGIYLQKFQTLLTRNVCLTSIILHSIESGRYITRKFQNLAMEIVKLSIILYDSRESCVVHKVPLVCYHC